MKVQSALGMTPSFRQNNPESQRTVHYAGNRQGNHQTSRLANHPAARQNVRFGDCGCFSMCCCGGGILKVAGGLAGIAGAFAMFRRFFGG